MSVDLNAGASLGGDRRSSWSRRFGRSLTHRPAPQVCDPFVEDNFDGSSTRLASNLLVRVAAFYSPVRGYREATWHVRNLTHVRCFFSRLWSMSPEAKHARILRPFIDCESEARLGPCIVTRACREGLS
jgi:hypothetical protein